LATNKAKKTYNDLQNLKCTWLSKKLQKVIEEVNSIGRNVFCQTKKKDHGTTMLNQFILVSFGVQKSERTRAGIAVLIRKNLVKDIQDI
jgi:hypothetical protein